MVMYLKYSLQPSTHSIGHCLVIIENATVRFLCASVALSNESGGRFGASRLASY